MSVDQDVVQMRFEGFIVVVESSDWDCRQVLGSSLKVGMSLTLGHHLLLRSLFLVVSTHQIFLRLAGA